MNIELRTFRTGDYLNLATLSDDQWAQTHYKVASSMMKPTDDVQHCILALDGVQIVGYIYGFVLPNKVLIPYFLYTLPAYRKNGIGKKLLEELEIATQCTTSLIFYNNGLHDYYSKLGYEAGDALEVAVKELPAREGISR